MLEQISQWGEAYFSNLLWSFAVIVFYLALSRFIFPKIEASVDKSNLKSGAAKKALHIASLLMGIIALAALFIVWGIDFSGLLLISTSIITLTGVALFANWSILSSVTSYFILLFHDTFRRGNFVRVVDGDNYVEGFISEIHFFNTIIVTESRDIILYPNNLLLTRLVMVNPRSRWQSMGKVTSEKNEIKGEIQD